jgi:hypothetical protein
MEILLICAGIAFLLAPLPICIYLLVQRSKTVQRLRDLETAVWELCQKSEESHQIGKAAPGTPSPKETEPSKPTEAELTPKVLAHPEPTIAAAAKKFPADYGIVFDEEKTRKEASPPPPVPPKPPLRQPPALSRITAFLRTIGLWPPEESSTAEAGLMQWWLPRIGGLLATLSIISFAVYISQGTPPWVRFVEMILADIVVLGIGFYFLKRRPKFGATLISTGLSMAYLSSIAAYAASPVRVIENPYVGILIQFAVIVGIFLISHRLSNRNIAIMALVYGFVSSIFSSYVGLLESALISALALYIIGIFFSRKYNWLPILSISTIGAYLPVLSFCVLKSIHSTTLTLPDTWSVIAYLLISVSLLPLCELRWNLAKSLNAFKSLHALNTTACLGVGYLYMRFFTNDLVTFYGIATIVFAGWAIILGTRGLNGYLFQLLFLKGSALAALWLVNRFEGDIRWFALIVEAVLICWIAARSKSLLQEIASLALWIISLGYALYSIGYDKLQVGEFSWYLYLIHPIIAAALLSYLKRTRDQDGRPSHFYFAAALLNGLAGIRFITLSDVSFDLLPMVIGAYGAILCSIGLIPRLSRAVPALSGALLILTANLRFWLYPYSELSFVLCAALSIGSAFAIARLYRTQARTFFLPAELLFHLAWVVTVYAYLANTFQEQSWFVYLPAAFSILLLVTPSGIFKTLRDASLVPLILFTFFEFSPKMGSWGGFIAVLAYLAVLFIPNLKPHLIRDFRLLRRWSVWRPLIHLFTAIILARIAFEFESWLGRVLILLLLAISFHLLWRIHKRYIALFLSIGFLGLGFASIVSIWDSSLDNYLQTLPWAREVLIGGLLATIVALGLGIDHAKSGHRKLSPRTRQILIYLAALLSFATVAVTLSSDLLWKDSSFTPLMALTSLVLVGIGIGAKIKPYRIVGLVGFALPLTKLFVHDIRDTLVRIVAFAILSVLSFLIGYLYHRFQSRIE